MSLIAELKRRNVFPVSAAYLALGWIVTTVIARATHGAQPGTALSESGDDRSVAVLPFVDMSEARDQEYLADGISEELLNLLAKVPQ